MPRLVELSFRRTHGYVFAVLPPYRLILSLGVINMKNVKSVTKATSVLCGLAFSLLLLTGCEPEVGTKGWCEKMDQKPKKPSEKSSFKPNAAASGESWTVES